jgi:mono/diheme cytochrome c family protein
MVTPRSTTTGMDLPAPWLHRLRKEASCALMLAALMSASPVVAQDGRALYVEHCASCHGAQLEGQPDWMERNADGLLPAPPHDATGHTWHHSDRQLVRIVRDGLATIAPGYRTSMQPFGSILDDSEIKAVLDYIKSTWPERERAFQAARSAADP